MTRWCARRGSVAESARPCACVCVRVCVCVFGRISSHLVLSCIHSHKNQNAMCREVTLVGFLSSVLCALCANRACSHERGVV